MTRAELDRIVTEAQEDELPGLVGDLSRLHALAFARLVAPKAPEAPIGNISIPKAAKLLGVSPGGIYARPDLPFLVKLGGRTVASAAALEKFVQRRMKGRE